MNSPDPRLTPRQADILLAIREWVGRRGYAPTVREIAAEVGLVSPSSVAHHLTTLERLGLIKRQRRGPRTVGLRDSPQAPTRRVPVLGTIAAGPPILAEESYGEHLVVSADLVGNGTLFALRVRGESMIDAAICDGDFVIVRREQSADDGDIVAALIDDEATVKVYRVRDGHVDLEPRNPSFGVINGDGARILGKVVAVIRKL